MTAVFYVCVSVHHNSILYKEPTRCSFGSIVYQSLQNYHCSGNRPRTSFWIHIIPTHGTHQWLLLHLLVLLMMDAESVQNM